MSRTKRLLALVVLAALLLAGLAGCGGGDAAPAVTEAPAEAEPTNTPEPTATPEPTETPEPTDTPEPVVEEDQALDTSALAAPEEFSSFRSLVRMTIQGTQDGTEIEEIIEFSIEETTDPLAQHVIISGMGFGDDSGTMEMYQVGDTMYMLMEDQWMSFPAEIGESVSQGLVEATAMLDETCGWKRQGDTEVNGVPVEHWTLTKEDLEECLTAEELTGMGEIDQISGEVYISKEEGYVALMELHFEGQNLDVGMGGTTEEAVEEGIFDLYYEVTDVNAPFTIELPAEALESSGAPSDIPTPADAEEVQNMFGMISFYSPSEAADVADFYREEMPLNGWTEVSDDAYGDVYSLEYSKDGRTASLLISVDEDAGMTSVLITVSEPE